MMRVTDIRATKRGRLAVYVEDEFCLSAHPDVVVASGLCIGDEVDRDALTDLMAENELKKAKEKALNLLSYKEYTKKGLVDRLRRTTDDETAEAATVRMEELGLLNDADYAARLARDLQQRKKYGVLRIRQELRVRGVPQDFIDDALAQLDTDEDALDETLRAVIARKYPDAYEDEATRRRAYAAMLRLGYTHTQVRQALRVREEYED